MDWLVRAFGNSMNCVAHPFGHAECGTIWGAVLAIFIVVVLLVLGRMLRRSYTRWREEQLAVEEIIGARRVAEPEVMDQFKWMGDKALDSDLSYDQLVGKIKEETAKQKESRE